MAGVGKILCATAVAVLSAAPVLAGTTLDRNYLATNRMRVNAVPEQPGTFEVFYRRGAWATDYWCAAGDYIKRFYDRSGLAPIYVARGGVGPGLTLGNRRSVVFTVEPSPEILALSDAATTRSISVKNVGERRTAAFGRAGCTESRRKLGSF